MWRGAVHILTTQYPALPLRTRGISGLKGRANVRFSSCGSRLIMVGAGKRLAIRLNPPPKALRGRLNPSRFAFP